MRLIGVTFWVVCEKRVKGRVQEVRMVKGKGFINEKHTLTITNVKVHTSLNQSSGSSVGLGNDLQPSAN